MPRISVALYKTAVPVAKHNRSPANLQDWLSEAELGDTFDNYDADHSGDISFDEFEHMVQLSNRFCLLVCCPICIVEVADSACLCTL